MATIRQIRRRIKSVQNTAKITKAMEMIAASKMRRAQQRVMAARPYSEKMLEVLANLAAQPREDGIHPLLEKREPKRLEIVHITPDRGLCGGLVANLNRRAGTFILESKVPVSVVAVGKKGRDFVVRHVPDVRAIFTDFGDKAGIAEVLPVARVAVDDYTSGYCDRVYLSYTQFVNTMVQKPVLRQLLPVEPRPEETGRPVGYIYEPDSLTVLSQLLPRFIEMQIYHAVLESIASEQSARMVAMRSATDNAEEMITTLTLELNKARQDMITKELLDIVGGVAALGE